MKFKKFASILLATILVFTLAVPALAMVSTADGSITITDSSDSTSPDGRTFKAYRILTVTLAADNSPAYAVPDSAIMKAFYGTRFHGNADFYNGKTQAAINDDVITEIAKLTTNSAVQAFAEAALTKAIDAAAAGQIDVETINGGTKTNLPYGYYVIKDQSKAGNGTGEVAQVSAVMLDTTTPDVEISLKANTPGIIKTITNPSDNGDATHTDGSIGDVVDYSITSTVPDMTDYDSYIFNVTDKLSAGLTLNYDASATSDGIVVKLDTNGDDDLDDATDVLTKGDDYTVTIDGQTMTITFLKFKQYNSYGEDKLDLKGKAIAITYSATINENANYGAGGDTNTASLIYSNDPSNDSLTGTTPGQTTYTYVTGLHILKVDGASTSIQPLVGAEFTLSGISGTMVLITRNTFTEDASGTYYKLVTGAYTETAPTSDNASNYESTTITYVKSVETDLQTKDTDTKVTATVGEDGRLVFEGLGEGTYTLTETKAPDGYNILPDPITVTITWNPPTSDSTACTWSCLINGVEEVTDGVVSFSVPNVKGQGLPSTGGIGTTVFYIGGIALILAAGLLLILKRKGKATAK